MSRQMISWSCRRLLLLLLSCAVLAGVSAVETEAQTEHLLGVDSDISLEVLDMLWNSRVGLVTYDKCDDSMCPPLRFCKKPECPKIRLQNTKEPPPKAYECHCEDPNEVPECGCLNDCCAKKRKEYEDKLACECKKQMAVPSRAKTHIVDPNAKPPPPPKDEKRKFFPRSSDPNPLPPIHEAECRPNVHGISPGNCRRGNSMSTCQSKKSQCKDLNSASKGFVAATLTDDLQPDDEPEDCTHEGSDAVATSYSDPTPNGDHAKAQVSVFNRCTKKSKFIPASEVFVHAPTVVQKQADGTTTVMGSERSFSPGLSSASTGSSTAAAVSSAIASALSGSASLSGSQGSLSGLETRPSPGSKLVPATASSKQSSKSSSPKISLSASALQSMISKAVSSALSASPSSSSQSQSK